MKRKILLGLLISVVAAAVMTGTVTALGGFESWRSLDMTGTGDSRFIMDRSGIGDSRFIIATSIATALPPTDLVLTLNGDNEVLISWTMGVGACNSMVRAAIGRVPVDRDDGYLVYYGNSTSTTDWIDEDETVYYRVWSESCTSTWETEGIWDSIGGTAVAMIVLGILALGLTVAMFALRQSMLGFPAGIFWAVLSGVAYQQSTTTWDWQYILFFGAIGMTIFCLIAAYALRKKDLSGPDADTGSFVDEGEGKETEQW